MDGKIEVEDEEVAICPLVFTSWLLLELSEWDDSMEGVGVTSTGTNPVTEGEAAAVGMISGRFVMDGYCAFSCIESIVENKAKDKRGSKSTYKCWCGWMV